MEILHSDDKSVKEKKFQEFFINDNPRNLQFYKHKSNKLNTAKYNIFTFLPKALILAGILVFIIAVCDFVSLNNNAFCAIMYCSQHEYLTLFIVNST